MAERNCLFPDGARSESRAEQSRVVQSAQRTSDQSNFFLTLDVERRTISVGETTNFTGFGGEMRAWSEFGRRPLRVGVVTAVALVGIVSAAGPVAAEERDSAAEASDAAAETAAVATSAASAAGVPEIVGVSDAVAVAATPVDLTDGVGLGGDRTLTLETDEFESREIVDGVAVYAALRI